MNTEIQRRRDVRVALVLAGVPLILLMCLLIISPAYILSFFDLGLQSGLLVIGLILFLTVAAFLAILGSLRVISSGRTALGIVLVILSLVLLVFPAILLIILTPAAIQIARTI